MSAPCKDCINRKVGCHSTCEDYKVFQKEREAFRENRNKVLNEENDWITTTRSFRKWLSGK